MIEIYGFQPVVEGAAFRTCLLVDALLDLTGTKDNKGYNMNFIYVIQTRTVYMKIILTVFAIVAIVVALVAVTTLISIHQVALANPANPANAPGQTGTNRGQSDGAIGPPGQTGTNPGLCKTGRQLQCPFF